MTRLLHLCRKVPTKFAPLYVHLDLTHDRRAVGLRVSTPGKFRDTAIEGMLDAVSEAATELLREAGK